MKLFLITLILLPFTIFSQNYNFHKPLNKLALVSTFGELRPNHFHSGLDFSGFFRIGDPVYAIDSGYVARIKVDDDGYGKAIYIAHYNGLMSVYAHLDKFNDTIENFVKNMQYKYKTFEITLYPEPKKLKIKKGQIIGYVGNTGRSYAPHLHFEIRDKYLDYPINPLKFGFKIYDNIPPLLKAIHIYPASDTTAIFNSFKKTKFYPSKNKIISVSGPFYLGIETIDYSNDNKAIKGIYSLKVLVNDTIIWHIQFDRFFFQNTRYINALVDYKEAILRKAKIYTTYIKPNNKLCIYKTAKNKGIISLPLGKHKITIKISDFYQNSTSYSFYVNITTANNQKSQPKFGYFVDYRQNFQFDTLNFSFYLPSWSLFDTAWIYFKILKNPYTKLSPIIQIANPYIPLLQPFYLTVKLPDTLPINKTLIIRINHKNKHLPLPPYLIDTAQNSITIKSYEFGKFYLAIDTTAPTIIPLNKNSSKNYSKIRFKLKDNLSGIKSYNVFVNNKWTLAEYDAKTSTLSINTSNPEFSKGLNHIKIIAKDHCNNTKQAEYQYFIH